VLSPVYPAPDSSVRQFAAPFGSSVGNVANIERVEGIEVLRANAKGGIGRENDPDPWGSTMAGTGIYPPCTDLTLGGGIGGGFNTAKLTISGSGQMLGLYNRISNSTTVPRSVNAQEPCRCSPIGPALKQFARR
jgi:hypothetical protein